MPKVTIYQVSSLGGEGKHIVGMLSAKTNESYADARLNMERLNYFDFLYDFVDDATNVRMQGAWEKGNLLEDLGYTITIIPKQASNNQLDAVQAQRLPVCPMQLHIPSVSASDSPTPNFESVDEPTPNFESIDEPTPNFESDTDLSHRAGEEDLNQGGPSPQGEVEPIDPHVSLLSELMDPKLKAHLEDEIQKFKEHLVFLKIQGMDYTIKSFDKNGKVVVLVHCGECHTNTGGSKKDKMDKASIKSCFTNFRHHHMQSAKHMGAMAKNRGETVTSAEVKRQARAAQEHSKCVLDEHIAIVDEINSAQSQLNGSCPFEIRGDTLAEDVELSKFKVFCNVCFEHMILVPRQKNLQSNLESHVNSKKHLGLLRERQRPPTSEPVLTGKAGRPRNDSRDNKQPRIEKYLTNSESGGGSSSRASTLMKRQGGEDPHPHPLLCWGLWRESYSYGSEKRLVKDILYDQFKIDGVWYAEPLVEAEVWSVQDQKTCVISGLFRHKNCSRVSVLGGGFTDLTCEHCYNIRKEADFRLKVFREVQAIEKRGNRGTGNGRRLTHLTIPEVQVQASAYRIAQSKAKRKERQLRHRILMLQKRDPKLRDMCVDSANKADQLRFCQNVLLCHKGGAFGGRETLWDLLRDIVANLTRSGKGCRWRPGTKVLMQTLYQFGGRRVINCLSLNAIGPSLNTLQKDRRSMIVFRAGIHVDQFKFIAEVYSTVKARLGISGPVPCYLAEDETCVKKTIK
ncbi:unnamed protein product [Calypogeia fissa]